MPPSGGIVVVSVLCRVAGMESKEHDARDAGRVVVHNKCGRAMEKPVENLHGQLCDQALGTQ
jgi:hypothetical protein